MNTYENIQSKARPKRFVIDIHYKTIYGSARIEAQIFFASLTITYSTHCYGVIEDKFYAKACFIW